jgi:hypothetical protein
VPGGVTVPRGPWRYDGEIDLGYGGALRMAATIITCDPEFGWFAYGGTIHESGRGVEVEPRDGLRRRLDIILPRSSSSSAEDLFRLKLELERDGFKAGGPVTADKALTKVAFMIENRTGRVHKTGARLSFPSEARYELLQDGRPVPLMATGSWDYPWCAELNISRPTVKVELIRKESR